MRVLIVEDDPNKLSRVRECVESDLRFAEVDEARSYQTGLKTIVERAPDLVVLDMAMPTYDVTPAEKGGRPRPFGGRDILTQMKRRRLRARVVVLTQYETFGEGAEQLSLPQLNAQLAKEFPENYAGAVFYHPAETDWRRHLVALLGPAQPRSGQ